MAKQSKAAVFGCGLDLDIAALRWQLHELGVKPDNRENNFCLWRGLDLAARDLAAGDAEGAGQLVAYVTENVTRLESVARATRARSRKRGLLKREVVALWNGQSRFKSVRSFAHWLARERKVIDEQLSEVKQKKQLVAYTQKIRRYLQNPQPSPPKP